MMDNLPASEIELRSVAEQLGLPFLDLDREIIAPELFSHLSVETSMDLKVVPISFEEGVLTIALSDPLDIRLEQRLASITGKRLALAVASAEQIAAALKRSEASSKMLSNVSSAFAPQIVREDDTGNEQIVDVGALKDQSGVVRLFNSVLMAGLQKQASDIHIEAYRDRIDVKYRIDGILHAATEPLDVRFHSELLSRIKIMAELDIAEKRIPQDGSFRLRIEGRDVDFRVSVLPTQFGENAVVRILDKSAVAKFGGSLSLSDLGLEDRDVLDLRRAFMAPHGLVLITGPTGSGKTTTLYGALSEIVQGTEKVITIEDPIEYELPGISQIAVNEKKGLTFASGLRSILRHDPDKIMVGEIRDLATAEIAIQAALTGHLVLASVHANSSFDVISRFTHWGIDLYDLVTALNAVTAQRLLRRVCSSCAKPQILSPEIRETAGLPHVPHTEERWVIGQGCGRCNGTGYVGRMAIVEHLNVTPEIGELILARSGVTEVSKVAAANGMRGLRQAAIDTAYRGLTTIDEINRVTRAD